MAPLSVLIVGCGIAGPILASLLLSDSRPAKDKPRITIVERASRLRDNGQNIDIRGEGVTVMRLLGMEKVIRASTTNEAGVCFVDGQNQTWASAPADRTGKVQTGTSDIEILRGRLAMICHDRCLTISQEVERDGGHGVEFIFGETIYKIEQTDAYVTVQFERSQERRTFDLVVGADGLQSQTRRLVWGAGDEPTRVHRLGLYGGFFSMPAGKTDGLWRRWYHAPGRKSVMVRPAETTSRSTVFMTILNDDDPRFTEVAERGRAGVQAQKGLLTEYFQDAGWECERLVREMNATEDFYYDMIAQVKMNRWSQGRIVLLGDAGYCASPLSGMGTTLSFMGAYHLAGAILRHEDDLTAAFNEYEKAMRPIVQRAQRLAPGMPRWWFPETQHGADALRWIFYLFDRSQIMTLLARFAGPPTSVDIVLEDYGFVKHAEMPVPIL